MDKLVDFSRQIEAYHGDGRVLPATVRGGAPHPVNGYYWVMTSEFSNWVMPADDQLGKGWRVRNIAPANPSTPSNEELTQRMEKAVRDLAARMQNDGTINLYEIQKAGREAQAIVSDLPKPVDPIDPDLIEARAIAVHHALPGREGVSTYAVSRGDADNLDCVKAIRAALLRGRELGQAAQEVTA